jgi:rhamnosyltransferase
MPKCAILLAAYNGEAWVEAQLDSILSQKHVDVVVYISVDVCSDDTLKICLDFARRDKRVVVLPSKLKFGNAAKNFFFLIQTVDVSTFDFIAFSDQDDVWFEEKIFRATSILSENKFHGYSSDVIAFWPNGAEKYVKKSYKQKNYDFYFESAGPGCTYVLTSSSFIEFQKFCIVNKYNIQKFDLHDWLIYAWYRYHSYKWYIDDRPSMLYRQHTENAFGSNHGFGGVMKRLSWLRAGWYKNQVEMNFKVFPPDRKPNFLWKLNNVFNSRRSNLHCFLFLIFTLLSWT